MDRGKLGLALLLLLGISAVACLQRYYPQRPPTDGVTFSFNERRPSVSAHVLQAATFGYQRVVSNLLWLRFLQYTPTERVPPGQLSWIYFDLDTISTIDPGFLPVFTQGAVFLSVITEDKVGAERPLKKGVELYPNDWRVQGNLGYHYQFELNQPEEAAVHYLAASQQPEAPWIFTALALKHMEDEGSRQAAIKLLEDISKNSPYEDVREKMAQKLLELKMQKNSKERR